MPLFWSKGLSFETWAPWTRLPRPESPSESLDAEVDETLVRIGSGVRRSLGGRGVLKFLVTPGTLTNVFKEECVLFHPLY